MDTSKITADSTATIATAACSVVTTRTSPVGPDMLDSFRDPKVCDILPTNDPPKPDPFAEFRPKPRTVIDYKISQTDIKSQLQQPLGITKIHIQDTSAVYTLPPPGYVFPVPPAPPPPPPEPVFQYSTGRGPLKEFIEDKWMRKVEKKQILAKQNLKKLIRTTRKFEKEKLGKDHEKLMKLVGPDWFQELSPQQLRTVDNLKNCIVKDVKFKTTCNTEINMAQLGLVLRPNPIHIQIALKKCCECPVEFLLILYQLLNKHRTDYSLNDRLLLSAVAHLTMRETLKELHIRIPSPPPPLKKEKKKKKEEKIERYKSPYLEPFTFRPEKRKHSGVYKNNHIQYPESPYFSYISELKSEMRNYQIEEIEEEEEPEEEGNYRKKRRHSEKEGEEVKKPTRIIITKQQSGVTDLQEKELVGELRVAQREYNSLVNYEPVPFLHKPSIYIPCDHGLKKKIPEPEEEESSENETNTTVSVEVTVTTDFDAYCQPIRKICECKITFDETKVPKHPPIEEDDDSSFGCTCSAVSGSEKNDVPAISPSGGVVIEEQAEKPVETKNIAVSTASRDDIKIENIEKSTSTKETVEQLPEEEPDTPIPTEPIEEEIVEEKLITVGQRESSECKCKEEVEKTLDTRLCQCEQCIADREVMEKLQKPTYIISGISETRIRHREEEGEEEGEEEAEDEILVVPIISGVKLKKTCDCLEKYQAKVKMYEEMKKSFDVQHTLKTISQQYIIGGVTYSHDGEPVYMLSGVTPKRECDCAKIYQEYLKEQERLANMPQIPLGRQKYVISGVHATDQGNVYVVSGTAPMEDCPCMKMYKSYESKHQPCLKMYEEYLKKIEMDTQEYMEEIATDPRFGEPPQESNKSEDITETSVDAIEAGASSQQRISQDSARSAKSVKSQEVSREVSRGFGSSGNTGSPRQSVDVNKPQSNKNILQTGQGCTCCKIGSPRQSVDVNKPQSNRNILQTGQGCTCCKIEQPKICCGHDQVNIEIDNDSSQKSKGKHVCICEPGNYTCICEKPDPADCECGYESSESEEEPLLHRFIIMDKIPCKPSQQIEIIKKALEVLAEDGFPLAKLPDSYKLPLFKLWMQLRCGRFWRQEERLPMLMQSSAHWRHFGYCGRKVRLPKLNVSLEQAKKYTWAHADIVRQMATEADVSYYRQVRQANIEDGREFFPTTMSYELPTSAFRDCYFAYTAGKEEDCVCWRPWYMREVKNFKNRKPC